MCFFSEGPCCVGSPRKKYWTSCACVQQSQLNPRCEEGLAHSVTKEIQSTSPRISFSGFETGFHRMVFSCILNHFSQQKCIVLHEHHLLSGNFFSEINPSQTYEQQTCATEEDLYKSLPILVPPLPTVASGGHLHSCPPPAEGCHRPAAHRASAPHAVAGVHRGRCGG